MNNYFFEKALDAMSDELEQSDRACDFCVNNQPHLLVCNKQCKSGILDYLMKQVTE